ncbi:MAG: UDP-glucose 4-epimerase GalE [Paracoccaceae bacterium]|nr:UDP-glucose 4-epimerase GalE [Paracoccaceae bacterium]
MKLLVTGGAGYIGTHSIIELLNAGHDISVIDDLSNSRIAALQRVRKLTKRDLAFMQADLCDTAAVSAELQRFRPDGVIHFAGLKAVGASVARPLDYYRKNVGGTLSLLAGMERVGCHKIVFSSSATVYGLPQYLPCDEQHPTVPVNPYGHTKLMIEQILRDWNVTHRDASAVCLRYFNPAGAHPSGEIGENPKGVPDNLMPFLAQVAGGHRPALTVFGNDFETRDGTGERDYIHVVDLARAHLAAIEHVRTNSGFQVFNIGTGRGVTVLELAAAFTRMSGRPIATTVTARRSGDLARFYANAQRAEKTLGWTAQKSLFDICADAWRWQRQNPDGYDD